MTIGDPPNRPLTFVVHAPRTETHAATRHTHRADNPLTLALALRTVVTAFAAVAQAADETGKWYLNPQYGYTWLDPSRDVPDGDHVGFGFGRHFSEHWSGEFNGVWGTFEGSQGPRKLDQSAYSL